MEGVMLRFVLSLFWGMVGAWKRSAVLSLLMYYSTLIIRQLGGWGCKERF